MQKAVKLVLGVRAQFAQTLAEISVALELLHVLNGVEPILLGEQPKFGDALIGHLLEALLELRGPAGPRLECGFDARIVGGGGPGVQPGQLANWNKATPAGTARPAEFGPCGPGR